MWRCQTSRPEEILMAGTAEDLSIDEIEGITNYAAFVKAGS